MADSTSALPAVDRFPGATRRNRWTLSLLGILLLAAGGAGAALGLGAFGARNKARTVIDTSVQDVADRWWFWVAVAALGLLIALFALSWLRVQLRSNRLGSFDLEVDRSRGETTLASSAVTDAVSDEVAAYGGVRQATARMSGSPDAPTLNVTATLDGRRPTGELADRIVGGAVAHARQALDMPQLATRVELRLASRRRRNVR